MRLVALTLLLVGCVLAQLPKPCSTERDCNSVSYNTEFVHCVDGTCECWDQRGFIGNATSVNKCRCQYPRKVDHDDDDNNDKKRGDDDDDGGDRRQDNAYCSDVVSSTAIVAQRERCDRLEAIARYVYEIVVYPRNLGVLDGSIDLLSILSPDAHSRFTPVGEFTGPIGFEEYYYGLGATPLGFVQSVKFRTLACDSNVVHFRVDLFFNQSLNPVGPPIKTFNFTHVGYFAFDDDDLISVADITFTNMGKAADVPADSVVDFGQGPIPTREVIIQGLCYQAIPTYCTGVNQQYASPQECLDYLHSIPYGSFDRGNSRSVTCITVHSALIVQRPDVHCPHVGPTGGGKCIDFTYESYYTSVLESALDALVAGDA